MAFDFELVGKIGSMALIRKGDQDIDYNIFSRIGAAAETWNDLGEFWLCRDRPPRLYKAQWAGTCRTGGGG